MSTTPSTPSAPEAAPRLATPPPPQEKEGLSENQQRAMIIGGSVLVIAVLAALVAGGVFLVGHPDQASVWRDVFIIFMALESLVIGVALVVLIVQLAVLTNLLKHEIKPILEATQETANTVRGTTLFLSENLVEPVMKLNSYVAGLSRLVETLGSLGGLFRR
jgi:MFS family permease